MKIRTIIDTPPLLECLVVATWLLVTHGCQRQPDPSRHEMHVRGRVTHVAFATRYGEDGKYMVGLIGNYGAWAVNLRSLYVVAHEGDSVAFILSPISNGGDSRTADDILVNGGWYVLSHIDSVWR